MELQFILTNIVLTQPGMKSQIAIGFCVSSTHLEINIFYFDHMNTFSGELWCLESVPVSVHLNRILYLLNQDTSDLININNIIFTKKLGAGRI